MSASDTVSTQSRATLHVPFVVAGRLVDDAAVEYRSRDLDAPFITPELDLNELVGSRQVPGPAFELKTSEVIDFLAATGARLELNANALMQDALEHMVRINPLGKQILTRCYEEMALFFDRDWLEFQVTQEVGGAGVLDGWRALEDPTGRPSAVRAFPPRLVHVLAGNGPGVAAVSIVRAALTKGVHLLKLPSNDLFTATAVLRTMAEVDPDHPILRSFSAVYWRGGDAAVESVIYRPQWFDKIVAWGGEAAIRSALQYLGPGLELVSFDPKVSISFIGQEAFASEGTLQQVAGLSAHDVAVLNQDACVASRYQFVEGSVSEVDHYCELLISELGTDRPLCSGIAPPPPSDVRDNVEVLRLLDSAYRVWGTYDGRGLVVRSEDPVDFHPSGKTVNVVPVTSLVDAVRFTTVATQTVGIYPAARKADLRDALIGAGVQRVVSLGAAADGVAGLPHDGMYPLHRFVRWAVDEGGES